MSDESRLAIARGRGAASYSEVDSQYLEARQLRKSAGWVLLCALGVGAVISGDFFGWQYGPPVEVDVPMPVAADGPAILPHDPRLPATGIDALRWLLLGLGLVVAGAAATRQAGDGTGRKRRAVSPGHPAAVGSVIGRSPFEDNLRTVPGR